MAEIRKSYQEGCTAAHALDLIGDRWALLVVRELMLGPRRFGAIRAGLPGIATNMLTRRLEDLEGAGLVRRLTLPPPASVAAWDLTPAGLALWPVLRELCLWGAAQPGHDPRLPISATALMLSMRATYLPPTKAGAPVIAGFAIGDETFSMVAAGTLNVSRGTAADAALRFTGPANTLAPIIYGPAPLTLSPHFTGPLAEGQAFIDRFQLRR